MRTKWRTAVLAAGLLALSISVPALAHGARIEYTAHLAIEILATFDTGEPMAEAQVVVFAPNDPVNPWLTGTTDLDGRFSFVPDTNLQGTWDVQVRQAGHGDIVHIPVGEMGAAPRSSGFTTLQLIIMGACVIWGFVGTALYFSRRRA